MSRLSRIFAYCILFSSFSFYSYACDLNNSFRHINPDGTTGGFRSASANVSSSAFIGKNAKVCDKAIVEDNVRILDEAIVENNAWIRKYSIVQNQARVSENAVIWGNERFSTIVSGSARVYGRAQILSGSKVSDNAEVLGLATLQSVIVIGQGKICENHILRNLTIQNSYFCSENQISDAQLNLLNYSEKSFNSKSSFIKVGIEGYYFSLDSSTFQVNVNGSILDHNLISLRYRELIIPSDNLKEGLNTVSIKGYDEFGKKLNVESFKFFVGSKTVEIPFEGNFGDKPKIDLKYKIEDLGYEGQATIANGNIVLKGIPDNLTGIEVEISIVGSNGFLYQTFSLDSSPLILDVKILPSFINNNNSFEHFFDDWQINYPNNAQLTADGVRITPHASNDILIAKTFSVGKDKENLSLKVLFPNSVHSNLFLGNRNSEVFFISKNAKKAERFQVTKDLLNRKTRLSNSEINLQVAKQFEEDEITVFIRIPSVENSKYSEEDDLILKQIKLGKISIEFNPINILPRNTDSNNIDTSIGACEGPEFAMTSRNKLEYRSDKLTFFSAGPDTMTPEVSDNRIFGSINIQGVSRSEIEYINIVGTQKNSLGVDVEVLRKELSSCGSQRYERNFDLFRIIKMMQSNHFTDHLFSLHFYNDLNRIDLSAGSKISIKLQVKLKTPVDNEDVYESKQYIYGVLVSPNIPTYYRYPIFDYYDSNDSGAFRTGGDKWILPAYVRYFETIIQSFSIWDVGDMTKLNGGAFLGHSTHNAGLDADIKFPGLNFSTYGDDTTKWRNALDKIDNFLGGIKNFYKFIRNIYVTQTQNTNQYGDPIYINPLYLRRKFDYRCYGWDDANPSSKSRFIELAAESWEHSLLRHVEQHYDHLHLRFNPTGVDLKEDSVDPVPFSSFSLNQLLFKLTVIANRNEKMANKYELEVQPINSLSFKNKRILLRIQSYDDFNEFEEDVGFGRWSNGLSTPAKINYPDKKINFYITGVNLANGGCKQFLYTFKIPPEVKSGESGVWQLNLDRVGKMQAKKIK